MPSHLADRIKKLRKRLDADALLVTNPVDIRYLTGFVGDDSWLLVPGRGRVVVLSDSRFEEQIEREAPHVRVVMRKKEGLAATLGKLIAKKPVGTLALQAAHVSLATRKALGKALKGVKLAAWDDGLVMQRAVKDDGEVRAIHKALAIQQRAYREMLGFIKPGMSEFEATAFLEYRMRSLGADGTSFPSIVAADANAALPHAIPGKSRIKAGGILLVDWGAKFNGYCSDLTRVIGIGRMKPRLREIYEVCLDAQLAAIDMIGPGVSLRAVDAAARSVIERAGYGERFGHGLGHGIGLDIHEQPVLSPRSKGVLEPGHVVTVEPGIYLPGLGGVRIEDDVLVTARGRRVLSDLPKSLESAML